MKMNAHDNSMETNTETVSQNFGIGNLAVLIGLLRKNVYQHRIRTLVQEYMSNGRDSQREAKTTKRMIVSIPNELSPVFKVRDFGVGITPQRMSGVFLQYGNSTKRKSNKETGGFGIGGKSAFAYTDSFTVTSITGGVKRTYIAHLGSANEGSMDLLSEVETTEESGVEIQVAVKPSDVREFRQACFRASYFWDESERPEFRGLASNHVVLNHIKGLMIGKELEINASGVPDFIHMDYHHKCLLVIDGIPYPVGEDLIQKIPNLESLLEKLVSKAIIHIGNGVIEVAMSREQIADSPFTLDALNALTKTMENSLQSHITSVFKAAKTTSGWIKEYKQLSNLANVDDYSKFGDYKIERSSIESDKFGDIEVTHVSLRTKRRAKNATIEREYGRFINLSNVDHMFVVDTNEPVVTQNKRLREYIESTPNRTSVVLINATEKKIVDPKWVRPAPIVGQVPVAAPMIVSLSFKDSQKVLTKIIADFNAKNLSTLPYTPTVRIPKAKRDRTKEMFTIHECTGHSKSPNTTTIEKVSGGLRKYLFVPFAKYYLFETEFNDLTPYMDKKGITLCGMTDDTIEMVKGCTEFESYADWKTNFKADAKILVSMKAMKAKNLDGMKLICRATNPIKDKHLAAMSLEYKAIISKKDDFVPDTLLKMCKDELTQFIADDEKLTKLLKEEYPLVKAVEQNDWRVTTEQVNELAFYINAKVKGK